MTAKSGDIHFKYKPLDDGKEVGVFSRRGFLDDERLRFSDLTVPIPSILWAQSRMNRIILEYTRERSGMVEAHIEAFAITSDNLAGLLRAINLRASTHMAAARKERLTKEGRHGMFREVACPHCNASIEVTGLEPSPQVYCPYCDTICTRLEDGSAPPDDETRFRLCDGCGYYAQPQVFTEFYFYFLFVVYGYRYSRATMCHTCMRGRVWRMFFYNLPFVLGVIPAVGQLFRAYLGGSNRSKTFVGLDAANGLAQHKRLMAAISVYREMIQRLPSCAGVWFNLAKCLEAENKQSEAIGAYHESLKNCSNYTPAFLRLRELLRTQERPDELAALQAAWNELAPHS